MNCHFSAQDGRRTIAALEHVPLSQLPDEVPVGAKITVAGPVECRRGVMMLANPSAVKYHGGGILQGHSLILEHYFPALLFSVSWNEY